MTNATTRMISELKIEVDHYLQCQKEAFDFFVNNIYHETVHATLAQVRAVVRQQTTSREKKEEALVVTGHPFSTGSLSLESVSVDVDNKAGEKGEGSRRYSQKWKITRDIVVPQVMGLETSTVPVSLMRESLARSKDSLGKLVSMKGGARNWGDRIRSKSPPDEKQVEKEEPAMIWNPVAARPSFIPKPPTPPPAPQALEAQEQERVKEDGALTEENKKGVGGEEYEEKKDKDVGERVDEGSGKTLRSFSACVKGPEVVNRAKAQIPALKQAAMLKEKEEKREMERSKRKALIMQRRKEQKEAKGVKKVAAKPDIQHCGVKRPSELPSSVSKKQKIERTNKESHAETGFDKDARPGHTTPSVLGSPILGSVADDKRSPQYTMTPVGLLDAGYDKNELRKNKHIPSWADGKALEKSMMQQRMQSTDLRASKPTTLNPREVFGTPNSMVVRNAARRAYRYDHRFDSSVKWSSDEDGESSV